MKYQVKSVDMKRINRLKVVFDETFNNPRYSYRVLFVQKSVNKKGQADKVIEFLPANFPEAEGDW